MHLIYIFNCYCTFGDTSYDTHSNFVIVSLRTALHVYSNVLLVHTIITKCCGVIFLIDAHHKCSLINAHRRYLLNPYSIVTCAGFSSSSLTTLTVAWAIWMKLRGTSQMHYGLVKISIDHLLVGICIGHVGVRYQLVTCLLVYALSLYLKVDTPFFFGTSNVLGFVCQF